MSSKIAFQRKAAISASRRRRLAEVPWFRSAMARQTLRLQQVEVEQANGVERTN